MITFPESLTATKYPGYFWDILHHKLYSIKVCGVLKELKRIEFGKLKRFQPYAWRMDCDKYCYQISLYGKRKYYTDTYLHSLELADSEIPCGKE